VRPVDRRIGAAAKTTGRRVPTAAEQPKSDSSSHCYADQRKGHAQQQHPAPHKTPITPMTAREVHGVVLYAWMGCGTAAHSNAKGNAHRLTSVHTSQIFSHFHRDMNFMGIA